MTLFKKFHAIVSSGGAGLLLYVHRPPAIPSDIVLRGEQPHPSIHPLNEIYLSIRKSEKLFPCHLSKGFEIVNLCSHHRKLSVAEKTLPSYSLYRVEVLLNSLIQSTYTTTNVIGRIKHVTFLEFWSKKEGKIELSQLTMYETSQIHTDTSFLFTTSHF